MTSVHEAIKRLIQPKESLAAGIYHYQSPPEVSEPYRLHLRIENNGQGILIVNASTILHLNKTATEYAYHFIRKTPIEELIEQINRRYKVNKEMIAKDFDNFKDTLTELIETPDLDPETYLGFDRIDPYTDDLSAPYRLDCALTYRLPEGVDPSFAPTKRVDRELSTEEWKAIIDKTWQVGIPHLIFTGGEPTLRDDLFELLDYSEQLGQVTGLNTEGKKLADGDYLLKLLQTGLDHLTIILNPDENTSWEVIKQCVKADIFLTVHLTVTLDNAISSRDVINRLNSMGVRNLSLSTTNQSLFSTIGDLRDYAADLELSLVWDIPVPYSAFNPIALEIREDVQRQRVGYAWLYIEPDGDVLPIQGVEKYFGNILTDSWENIWSKARKSE